MSSSLPFPLSLFLGLLLCLQAPSCASSAAAAESTTFEGRLVLPPHNIPYPFTPVTLNAGQFNATSDADGKFSFYGVEPGVYNLEVGAHGHAFPTVKIKFTAEEMDSPKCNLYLYLGSQMQPVGCESLEIPALAKYQYFEVSAERHETRQQGIRIRIRVCSLKASLL